MTTDGGEKSGGEGVALPISAADSAALLRKYQVMAAWRQRKDTGGSGGQGNQPPPDRAALRALSREFPGALRELDVLGLPEMLRRITRLQRLTNEKPPAPAGTGAIASSAGDQDDRWLTWIVAYHALMRAALQIKRRSGRPRQRSPAAMVRATTVDANGHPLVAEESFVSAVIHPPEGRVGIVVLTALAERFQTPAAEISRILFPPRRPPPYKL